MQDRKADDSNSELSILQVFAFYLIAFFLGALVSVVLRVTGRSALDGPIVSSGLYGVLIIPVAYKFDRRIFSKNYWRFPSRAWAWILIAVLAQIALDSATPYVRIRVYRRFAAMCTAPLAEESARAVMIRPLTAKLGVPAGIMITSLMWTLMHHSFWMAICQQLMLSLVFVYTSRSLSAAVATHTAMNVIAAWQVSLQTALSHL